MLTLSVALLFGIVDAVTVPVSSGSVAEGAGEFRVSSVGQICKHYLT